MTFDPTASARDSRAAVLLSAARKGAAPRRLRWGGCARLRRALVAAEYRLQLRRGSRASLMAQHPGILPQPPVPAIQPKLVNPLICAEFHLRSDDDNLSRGRAAMSLYRDGSRAADVQIV
jgi:hypothetical protein